MIFIHTCMQVCTWKRRKDVYLAGMRLRFSAADETRSAARFIFKTWTANCCRYFVV